MNLAIGFILALATTAFSQKDSPISARNFDFSLGPSFYQFRDIGKVIPSVSITYTKQIKHIGLAVTLHSFYARNFDFDFERAPNGTPHFNLIARGAALGPFVLPEEINAITGQGIKDLSSYHTYKVLHVPLGTLFLYHPLKSDHHAISLGAGPTVTYAESNYYREILGAPEIITSSGTFTWPNIFLSLQTEFRSIFLGSLIKVGYTYKMKKFKLGLEMQRFNQFELVRSDYEPFWNIALTTGFYF